jgi:hypothetical protein
LARFRTPELEGLLLCEIREHETDGIASTEDVMPAGVRYIQAATGEMDKKVVTDSVRWALIFLCDTAGLLERPFGKTETYEGQQGNRRWLIVNRPRQSKNQGLWRLSEAGRQIV